MGSYRSTHTRSVRSAVYQLIDRIDASIPMPLSDLIDDANPSHTQHSTRSTVAAAARWPRPTYFSQRVPWKSQFTINYQPTHRPANNPPKQAARPVRQSMAAGLFCRPRRRPPRLLLLPVLAMLLLALAATATSMCAAPRAAFVPSYYCSRPPRLAAPTRPSIITAAFAVAAASVPPEQPCQQAGPEGSEDGEEDAWLPRAVYVHLPFCRRRCYYCDFPIKVGRPAARVVLGCGGVCAVGCCVVEGRQQQTKCLPLYTNL